MGDIVLGVVQLTAGFSLFAGNAYGRIIGVIAGSLGAIAALLSIGGANPWWSLAIFFLCVSSSTASSSSGRTSGSRRGSLVLCPDRGRAC